jgi:ABC-2 type transport system permease protein
MNWPSWRSTARSSMPTSFRRSATTRRAELDDPRRRREEHLGSSKKWRRAAIRCTRASTCSRRTPTGSRYHTIVSTTDDQIAIAPGYLKRDWHKDGRHYYEYSMGAVQILDFYRVPVGSATRCASEVYAGVSGPINLEVYYDPAHEYNVDDMLAASRAGLDYYERAFQPLPVQPVPHH